MKEKPVEDHLHDEVKIRAGFCIKLNPLWNIGIPDRLVILPGLIAFVECKRPRGGRFSVKQLWWKKRLQKMGHAHYVLNTKDLVDDFLARFPVRSSYADTP